MTDWKKISLIVGTIAVGGATLVATGKWALEKYVSSQEIKKNADEAPLIAKRLSAHEIGDTLKYIDVKNDIKGLRSDFAELKSSLKEVKDALDENNRLRQWEKFNTRKLR